MNDINALRAAHLLGALAYGLSAGTMLAYVLRDQLPWALLALAIFAPAAVLTALTWNELVKEEYR